MRQRLKATAWRLAATLAVAVKPADPAQPGLVMVMMESSVPKVV